MMQQGGEPIPALNDCILFVGNVNNSSIGLVLKSSNQYIEYSIDKSEWHELTPATTPIILNERDCLYVRGILSGNNSSTDYTKFSITGDVDVKGNIQALLDYNNPDSVAIPYTAACLSLFRNCHGLKNAGELLLPATTLSTNCYNSMFADCWYIETVPELPALILPAQCYRYMFLRCYPISRIKCLATNISARYCVDQWVVYVQTNSGVFIKHPDMQSWTIGGNVPANWTVEDAVL